MYKQKGKIAVTHFLSAFAVKHQENRAPAKGKKRQKVEIASHSCYFKGDTERLDPKVSEFLRCDTIVTKMPDKRTLSEPEKRRMMHENDTKMAKNQKRHFETLFQD